MNSLINNIYANTTVDAPRPVVGMAATTLSLTDRHAATVVKVTELTGQYVYEISVTDDDIQVVSGSTHDGSAKFVTTPNFDAYPKIYRQNRKTKQWIGGYINADTDRFCKLGGGLILGFRDHYVDPSF